MTLFLVVVTLWSLCAATWWGISGWTLSRPTAPPGPLHPTPEPLGLSVFKALPPTPNPAAQQALRLALDSFLPQLTPHSELLLATPPDERSRWETVLEEWRAQYPQARIRCVNRPHPEPYANPKIGGLEALAPEAHGALWLWSDADVVAPKGWLDSLERELTAASGAAAVTSAYCIRHVRRAQEMLDACFVNLEFLPGARFVGHRSRMTFAFGAGVIFRAADFHERVRWSDLGRELADDYALGQRLGSVALGQQVVETLPLPGGGWSAALRHYYRWHKTIRWCRPGGYAGLALIMPLIGWSAAALARPATSSVWIGLAAQWLLECLVAWRLLRQIGCQATVGAWLLVPAWPWLRVLNWLAAWLPIPVAWGDPTAGWSQPRAAR